MRRTGIIKKTPLLDAEFMPRFAAISKAKWFDLYADLFRATHEEASTDKEIMSDAETRLAILIASGFYDKL